MRLSTLVLSCTLALAGVAAVRAQVVPAATARQISVTAGGTVSVFQPDFTGIWSPPSPPVAESSPFALIGVGTYVDVRLSRWVQLEAEGRWQRFNQYYNVYQDNYLAGPRLPVYRFWRSTVYGKALGGISKMKSNRDGREARFTNATLAFGGGMDIKLTRRLSWRAADVEYQYWPQWGNSHLSPYGASMGIGYKIF